MHPKLVCPSRIVQNQAIELSHTLSYDIVSSILNLRLWGLLQLTTTSINGCQWCSSRLDVRQKLPFLRLKGQNTLLQASILQTRKEGFIPCQLESLAILFLMMDQSYSQKQYQIESVCLATAFQSILQKHTKQFENYFLKQEKKTNF